MPGKLILVRHGQSIWNVENLFTGWYDVDLSDTGREEAAQAGRELRAEKLEPHIAFTSVLKRAIRTLWLILDATDRMWMPVERSWRLERAPLRRAAGLNKAQTVEKHGEAQVKIWRRSYDIPPPPLDAGRPAASALRSALRRHRPAAAARHRIAQGHPGARTALLGIAHRPGAARRQERAGGCARQLAARAGEDARQDVGERHRGVQHPDRYPDALRARRADPAGRPPVPRRPGTPSPRRRKPCAGKPRRRNSRAVRCPARSATLRPVSASVKSTWQDRREVASR